MDWVIEHQSIKDDDNDNDYMYMFPTLIYHVNYYDYNLEKKINLNLHIVMLGDFKLWVFKNL